MKRKGLYLALSPARRMVSDLMHVAAATPTVTAHRRMALEPVVEARQRCTLRPSWTVIFMRAFSLVAMRQRELRRALLRYPCERLYEHPCSVATVAIERDEGIEPAVFLTQVRHPERESLASLDARLWYCKTAELDQLSNYRRIRRLAKWPRFVRRSIWRACLHWSGPLRVRRFGTFGISSPAAFGAGMTTLRSVLASNLHYGLFDERGDIDVYLTFDHCVYDGAVAARALSEIEATLLGEIHLELQAIARKPSMHDPFVRHGSRPARSESLADELAA